MLLRTSPQKAAKAGRSGFTLLEILIVVAIIVMLAGAGGYYFFQQYEQSKVSKAKMDVHALAQRLQEWMALNSEQPAPGSLMVLTQPAPNGGGALMGADKLKDPWGKEYQLDMSNPTVPIVFTTGPNGQRIASSE